MFTITQERQARTLCSKIRKATARFFQSGDLAYYGYALTQREALDRLMADLAWTRHETTAAPSLEG